MRLLPLFLLLVPLPTPAFAAEWAPPAEVAARVAARVAERWEVEAGTVRLEWPAVPEGTVVAAQSPVELQGTGSGGYWTVVFGAPAELRVRVRAGVEEKLPVAVRPLSRGTEITTEDFAIRATVHWGAPGRRPAEAQVGWVTRRVIAEGEPLQEPAVAPPLLIRAGETVEVVWRGERVELRVRGSAAGSARQGERVTVRIDGRRRVQGIAVAPGTVQLEQTR